MGRPAAFFDVDGTLASSNVISTYLDFRLSNAGILRRWAIIGAFLPRAAFYAYLDTRSRRRFLQSFMANYAGVRPDELRIWAERAVHDYWARKVFPGALASIQHHRQQGHYVVILSGGLWDTLAPLAGHLGVDSLLASRMETIAGCYSGKLAGEPVSDEAKTQTSRDLAAEMGLDLSHSYAYADSFSDRDLLESVGRPVAVNPDRQLRTLAQQRQWPIEVWTHNAPGHQS